MSNAKQKKKNKIIAISIVVVLVITSMTTLFGMLASIL
jgi:flagellar basal body-associated protein FliL